MVSGASHLEQNWVVVSMFGDQLKAGIDFDAAWLGNGCSPSPPVSPFTQTFGRVNDPGAIGPLP